MITAQDLFNKAVVKAIQRAKIPLTATELRRGGPNIPWGPAGFLIESAHFQSDFYKHDSIVKGLDRNDEVWMAILKSNPDLDPSEYKRTREMLSVLNAVHGVSSDETGYGSSAFIAAFQRRARNVAKKFKLEVPTWVVEGDEPENHQEDRDHPGNGKCCGRCGRLTLKVTQKGTVCTYCQAASEGIVEKLGEARLFYERLRSDDSELPAWSALSNKDRERIEDVVRKEQKAESDRKFASVSIYIVLGTLILGALAMNFHKHDPETGKKLPVLPTITE